MEAQSVFTMGEEEQHVFAPDVMLEHDCGLPVFDVSLPMFVASGGEKQHAFRLDVESQPIFVIGEDE